LSENSSQVGESSKIRRENAKKWSKIVEEWSKME
jgi:hypothetical protein